MMKNIFKKAVLGTAVIGFILLVSCKKKEDAGSLRGNRNSSTIKFISASLYPGGIAYYERNHSFIVSSIKQGTIGSISENGQYITLMDDPSLISVGRLKIKDDFLYACVGDVGGSKKSSLSTKGNILKLVKIDLKQNKIIHTYDLATYSKIASSKPKGLLTDFFIPKDEPHTIHIVNVAGESFSIDENSGTIDSDSYADLEGIVGIVQGDPNKKKSLFFSYDPVLIHNKGKGISQATLWAIDPASGGNKISTSTNFNGRFLLYNNDALYVPSNTG